MVSYINCTGKYSHNGEMKVKDIFIEENDTSFAMKKETTINKNIILLDFNNIEKIIWNYAWNFWKS